MVQVIFPLSYVALLAILGLKVPESIRLIVLPVAFIRVTIGTPELSLAICLVIEPFSFVLCPVRPFLLTIRTLLALLINVACIICIFCDLQILNIGELVLLYHLPEFLDLLLRSAIVTFKVLLTGRIHLLLRLQT